MRHGDAGQPYPDEAMDRFRPLSPKGVNEVTKQAKWLDGKGKQPDLVVTDDSTRCIQTGKIMADQLGLPIELDSRLCDGKSAEKTIEDYKNAGRKPLYVTHDHVMAFLDDDDPEDKAATAEIRRHGHGDRLLKVKRP